MDNNESVIQALHEFENMTDADKVLTQELEDVFTDIAATGRIQIPWIYLKPVFMFKLDKVMRDFFESSPSRNTTSSEPTHTAEFDVMRQRLLDCVESFTSAPFTVQRLCELLVEPKRHYKSSEKFMRGVEKNVLVVSTMADIESEELVNNHSITIPNGPVTNGITTPGNITETTALNDFNSNGNHFNDMHYSPPDQQHQNGNYTQEQKEEVETRIEQEESKSIEEQSDEKRSDPQTDKESNITDTEDTSHDISTDDRSPTQTSSEDEQPPNELPTQEDDTITASKEEQESHEEKEKEYDVEKTQDSPEKDDANKENKAAQDDQTLTVPVDQPMEEN